MVQTTDDGILKQDMPPALTKVESAAKLLEEAATLSQIDPLSSTARQKLIEGSRWILQGILKSYYWLGDYYIVTAATFLEGVLTFCVLVKF